MGGLLEITDDGRLRVNLHEGQTRAWNSPRRFITVCAGTQGGKTSFGPVWLWREMRMRGPGDYLVATPTYPLLALKLLPELTHLYQDVLRLGEYKATPVKAFHVSREGSMKLWGEDVREPTRVLFGHAQDPDSLESATAKGAWLDEVGQKKFKLGSWQAIQRRLSVHEGRALLSSTPYDAFGWFKTELHDRHADGDPDYDFIRFESRMNPAFPESEWERAKRTLPKWKFDLFYRGVLAKPAGLIYDCWDPAKHVCEDFHIPDDWPRYLGLDFGAVNTAALFIAKDPATGMHYVYREYQSGGRTANQHVYQLRMPHNGNILGRLEHVSGGVNSEQNWRDEFSDAGLYVSKPSVTDVEVGIDRAYELIRTDRLRVFQSCENFISDIETYSRKLDENDEVTNQIEKSGGFHLVDAFRYIASDIHTEGGWGLEHLL